MMPNLQKPKNSRKQSMSTEIESLQEQLSKIQEEQNLLRNTLFGLACVSDISIGTVCPNCGKSYMLTKRGLMSCPSCRNRVVI